MSSMDSTKLLTIFRKYAIPALLLASIIFTVFPWFRNAFHWPFRILFSGALIFGSIGLALKFVHTFRDPKRLLFSTLALLLGCVFAYAFLELFALLYLKSDPNRNANPLVLTDLQREAINKLVKGEPDYTAFDSTLGWAIKPNGVSADGNYQANSAGFRANREYSPEKQNGVTRVICFGDSYTHGNNVGNEETWPYYAEAQQEGWEFLNFGVGAFGMAQAYLRYQKFKDDFETDYVVIGCMTDNIRRTVNVYYPFRLNRLDATSFALAKPWASLNGRGELEFHANPLPTLEAYDSLLKAPERMMRQMAKQDILFEKLSPTPLWTVTNEKIKNVDFSFFNKRLNGLLRRNASKKKKKNKKSELSPFDPESIIFRINGRLLQEFVKEVEASGAKPVILWFPRPKDVDRFNEHGERVYESFLRFFEEKDLPYIDSLDWISEAYGNGGEIPTDKIFYKGHFTPPVNQLIGERLGDYLKSAKNRDSSATGSPTP